MNTTYPDREPFEEPNPFDELSAAELAGFIHRKYGDGALRSLLERDFGTPTCREWILDVVCELQSVGLVRAAEIAAEVAATKPTASDMALCPYLVEPYLSNPSNATNISHWLRGQEQRRSDWELKRQQGFKAKAKNYQTVRFLVRLPTVRHQGSGIQWLNHLFGSYRQLRKIGQLSGVCRPDGPMPSSGRASI